MTRSKMKWLLLLAVVLAAGPIGCGQYYPSDPEPNGTEATKIRDGLLAATSKPAANAGAQAAAQKFDGWATLKGRFVFDGSRPNQAKLTIDRDPQVCGVNPLVNESVVVSPDGGLANVVVFVRTPKIPIHPDLAKPAAAKVVLDNKGCRFEPHVLGVRVGQTLVVTNSDGVPHSTKINGQSLQGNPTIASHASAELSVDAAEPQLVPVSCAFHGWMAGRLVVRPDPYFAITDASGNFEIRNLPAGDLEFQVWQENAGDLVLDQPDLKWDNKGRFHLSLHNGEQRDLKDLKVSAAALKVQ